jgi:hypothetical protein
VVAEILGDQGHRLVSSGDAVIDSRKRTWFLSLYKETHEVITAEKVGRETVQYVSNIYKYDLAYSMIEEERAVREEARKAVKQEAGK